MRFQSKISKLNKVQKMVLIAMFVSMALVLSYIERLIPMSFTFPGVKLGLANIVTLTSLYFLTFGEALLLVFLRVILNSFFAGSIFSFWYSLSGGILSLIVMYLLVTFVDNKVSSTGISVAGAVSHNIGQLIMVAIITENVGVAISYFPILAISGVITGILIGLVVTYLLTYLKKFFKARR